MDIENVTVLGFDIGGTKTAIVLGDLKAQILARAELPTAADLPFDAALSQILEAADGLLSEAQAKGIPAPQAVSVAVGGPLDIERGVILSPPHLPNWNQAPLKDRLEERYRLPTRIEHDGNAGALAEYYYGAGVGSRSMLYLTMGTGLGAGLILDGRLYRGATDTAGEVGHMRIAPDGPIEYGKAGAWEAYCSASGIGKLAALRAPAAFPPGTKAQQIIRSALDGDPRAKRVIVEAGEWLGRGLAVLVDILNPELIVLGTLGYLLGDLLIEPARRTLAEEALPIPRQACRVVPGLLSDNLGNVSALMAILSAVRTNQMYLPYSPSGEVVLGSLRAGIPVRQATLANLLGDIHRSALLIVQTLRQGGKVLAFGNGGSAAAAQHLAGELAGRYKGERRSLPGIALTADSSLLTCIANDYSFEDIFSRQVEALAGPGDLAIGFTTSGRSPNVLKGLQAAKQKGAATLALTGQNGLASPVADLTLAVPSTITARIQEEHDAILHAWCEVIDAAFSS